MNRIAINFFRVGRNDDALMWFAKAMALAQERYADAYQRVEATRYLQTRLVSEGFSYLDIVASMSPASFKPKHEEDDGMKSYFEPFLINEVSLVAPNLMFAALSFNMGLVYHQAGLSEKLSSSLKIALKYYDHGLMSLRHNASQGFASNGMCWLSLALLNNCASILWEFWDIREALECRKRMTILLLGTMREHGIFNLPNEVIEFFIECYQSCPYSARCAAPAA